MHEHIFLIGAGFLGGMINAIAGGGGIIMYPAFLASGLSPLIANATTSLAVWPGSVASAYGYRKDIKQAPRVYLWFMIPCFFGAFIGASLLVSTGEATFEKFAPWFVLSAVVLLTLQSRIHRFLSAQTKKRKLHWHTMPLLLVTVFCLTIYGSYFGAGFGLMILAVLGFTRISSIHQMNGLKNMWGIAMSIVSITYFSRAGLIDVSSGLTMAVGTIIGGLTGSRFAHKISTHLVHDLTIVIGFIIVIALFIKL